MKYIQLGISLLKRCYKTIFVKLLALSFLLLGCTTPSGSINVNNQSKTQAITSSSEVTDTVTSGTDKDFDSFFKRFSGDSVFQQERIKFPLEFIWMDDEEEVIKWIEDKEWKYTDFIHFKSVRLHQEKITDESVKLIFMVEDTGVLIYYYFQKRDGKWMLVFVEDYST